MNQNDLKFDQGNYRLNFRSAAVIIERGYVLLHKLAEDDFWALPGGRVKFFEFSEATVVRELQEELGWQTEVIRQLWYVESFFELNGRQYHELGNYFLTRLVDVEGLDFESEFYEIGRGKEVIFKWFKLEDVASLNLMPVFLNERLTKLPEHLEYIKVDEL